MRDISLIPEFLNSPQGRIFTISHANRKCNSQQAVILVPPFAEEMNKSRRMLTLVAEALAGQGYHVLLLDMYGTGDSDGNFSDASWKGWLEQLDCCIDHVKRRYGIDSYSLLGVRSGALLISEYLSHPQIGLNKLIFWQPVVDGANYLNQFLRLRLAASMLASGEGKESGKELKQLLANGEEVEVAGYGLRLAVSEGLASSSLKNVLPGMIPSTCWIDVVSNEGQAPPLVNRKLIDCWIDAGVAIQHLSCIGEPFWGSSEIIENHDVVEKTVDFLIGECVHDA